MGQSSQKASACNVVIAKSEADTGVYEALYFFRLIKVSVISHAFTFSRAGGGGYIILIANTVCENQFRRKVEMACTTSENMYYCKRDEGKR